MRSQTYMNYKDYQDYYNKQFSLKLNAVPPHLMPKQCSLNEFKVFMKTIMTAPPYIKPIYAIGTTVTYRVGNGYKMGKIIKAFTFKGKWRYVFEGRKDKIQETDIKDIIVLNNQALIEGL